MIAKIMTNEWTLLAREWATYIALPIYAVFLAYGVANGTAWKSFLQENVAEAKALANEGFEKKLDKIDKIIAGEEHSFSEDPRVAGPLARYKGYEFATKPPLPTAAIAIGQSDVAPSYLKVQWRPMFKQQNVDEIENPENLAAGAFDLSFVLIYLFPLLIIALSYNMLSAERESGTQVLLLSQPVPVHKFVLAKILLRGGLVIGLAVGISIIGLLISNPDMLAPSSLWRVGALAVILVLYGLFWFGVATAVNAMGQKSATNALVMMASWIFLVLIAPAVLNLAAKSFYPLPSRIEMVQAMRLGDEQAAKESGFERAYRADLLRKSEEAALEASVNDFYLKVLPLEKQAEAIASPIFEKFESRKKQQQNFAENLKYLSPAAITQIAISELANHSAANFNDFNEQVAQYHEEWRNYFFQPVMENRKLSRAEVVNIPRFTYEPESDGVVAGRIFGNVVALFLFAAAVIWFGFTQLRRYSPAKR